MKKVIMLMLVLTIPPGCASITAVELLGTVGSWAADGIVEAETGKGIADKVVSDITGKDCTLKNVFKDNENVCKELLEKENQTNGKRQEEQR